MYKLILLISVLLLSHHFTVTGQASDEQQRKQKIKAIAEEIDKCNVYKSMHIGIGGGPVSDQWQRYEELKTVCTNEELVALTLHKNPVVRCYAFQALVRNNYAGTFDILVNHLNDTEFVNTIKGCRGSVANVCDEYFSNVFFNGPGLPGYALNKSERRILDSLVLYNDNTATVKRSLCLLNLQPLPEFYNRIKAISINESDGTACTILARYRKQQDTGIFIKLFTSNTITALKAAREFPDNAFYPYLKNMLVQDSAKAEFLDEKCINLCLALAQYPRAETFALFNTILTNNPQTEWKFYILAAIQKYPHPIFESLKLKVELKSGDQNYISTLKDWY